MIRHIVMWKFREGTEREQEQFLTGLRGLFGVIPQLRRCEVKRCIGKDNYDAVLVSEFASMEDLQTYKDDPRHKAACFIGDPATILSHKAEPRHLNPNHSYLVHTCGPVLL